MPKLLPKNSINKLTESQAEFRKSLIEDVDYFI